jgi:hypothetical protein
MQITMILSNCNILSARWNDIKLWYERDTHNQMGLPNSDYFNLINILIHQNRHSTVNDRKQNGKNILCVWFIIHFSRFRCILITLL